MAFTTRQNNSDRTTTFVVVTILEAAVVYALIAGLTAKYTQVVPIPNPSATFTVTPKETPTTLPTHTATLPSPLPHPTLPLDPIQPTPLPTISASPGPIGETFGGTGTIIKTSASPSTAPLYRPRGPVPRGRTEDWVTTGDYPSTDLREGNQGVVKVRLEVTAAGRVGQCTITVSSGFPGLDAATCAKLVARARFDPATDENGARTAGSWSTSVRWAIPKD